MKMSQKILTSIAMTLLVALSASAADKKKDEETLRNASSVLQAMLDSRSVPPDLLAKAECIIVLPSVKKFGLGIGGSGGRGPMSCRTPRGGTWSAPAMYSIGGLSAGLQVGGSSTDYVLLVMTKKGVEALMNSKTSLGKEATVAAGPGASAGDIGSDIATYTRAQGLFAGVSLSGATLEPDNAANKRLYDKEITAKEIVIDSKVAATEGGKFLQTLLDSRTSRPAAK
jgi:lipid-binding SYLF domain-containing protein